MKDDNLDGQMSRDEYERWVDIEQTDPTVNRIVKKHFDYWDNDKNGVLTISDIGALFNYADTNRDDHISKELFRRSVIEKIYFKVNRINESGRCSEVYVESNSQSR